MNTIVINNENCVETTLYTAGSLFLDDEMVMMLCQYAAYCYTLIELHYGNRVSATVLNAEKVQFKGFTLGQIKKTFNIPDLEPILSTITITPDKIL